MCEPCTNNPGLSVTGVTVTLFPKIMECHDIRCAFTSNQSTWDGRSFADCSKNKAAWAWVCCEACVENQLTYRCSACYHKFQSTLSYAHDCTSIR